MHSKQPFKRLVILVSLMLMGVLFIIPASAQDEELVLEPIMISISGEVEATEIDGVIVVSVDGVVLSPNSMINPAALTPGMIIEITGNLLDDDTIQIITINFNVVIEEEVEEEVLEPEVTPEPDEEDDVEAPVLSACVPETHPVANRIAAEFDVDVAIVLDMHCQGNGFGNIARAFLLAENAEDEGIDAQYYLDMHQSGTGWGNIMREAGVHPSELAPGRVMNGKGRNSSDDVEGEEGATSETQIQGNQGRGNGNGNGNNGRGNGNGNNGNGNGNGNNGNGNGNGGGNGRGNGRP